MLLSFIFALACSPDKSSDTGDATDTGNPIDTANDTGEDSVDTGDTSDTGSSDDTFVLDFEFVGELTASKLILVEFSFGGWAEGSAFDVFEDQVAFAPIVDSAPSLVMQEPSGLEDLDDGGKGRFYMSFMIEDNNENGQHDENEAVLGYADKMIAYLKDSPIADDGWYTLDIPDFTAEEAIDESSMAPYSTVVVSANLASTDEITLSGVSDYSESGLRLALVSMVELEMESNLEDVGDVALDATWSLTLDSVPADTQYVMIEDGPPYWLAPQVPMVYSDDNGNELKDGGEFPIGYLCHNETIVRLTHYSYAHTLPAAMAYMTNGFTPGWILHLEGESESPTDLMLEESDWSMLNVGPDCTGD